MPNPNFLQPSYNKIIETDPQIQKVPLPYAEFGSRKSIMDRVMINEMIIEHVESKK